MSDQNTDSPALVVIEFVKNSFRPTEEQRKTMVFKLTKKLSKNGIRKLKRYPETFVKKPFIIKQMKEQGLNVDEISELTHMPVDKISKIFSE